MTLSSAALAARVEPPRVGGRKGLIQSVLLLMVAMTLMLAGCGKSGDEKTVVRKKGTLIVWAWPGYFPEVLRDKFRDQTGFAIEFGELPADEELLSVLANEDRPVDLIMPSAFVAKALREQKLIVDFDKSLFSPDLVPMYSASIYNPDFDTENDYVIPYAWGATGIGYDAERVIGLPSSWSALFSGDPMPPIPPKAWGHQRLDKIVLLDDARFTLGSVLLFQGKSPNTKVAQEVYDAADLLVELGRLHLKSDAQKQYYRIEYEEVRIPDLLRRGEIGLTMAWSADVTTAMHDSVRERNSQSAEDVVPGKPSLRIALPAEGSILFRDSFIIPRQVKPENWEAAHRLIEFMLDPHHAAVVTNSSFYATTVTKAVPYVDRFILNGPSYFIHALGNNRFLEDLDEEMRLVYRESWANVKNGRLYGETLASRSGGLQTESTPTIVGPDLPPIDLPAGRSRSITRC
ncbi:MAG: ABC transporter substrate-binding protein [bacterium]